MTEIQQKIDIHDSLAKASTAKPIPFPGENFLPKNVSVHFHFAPHTRADHFDVAKEHLKSADIYMPELPRWTDKSLKIFNSISKGDQKLFAREMRNHPGSEFGLAREVITAIYRTYKPIILIDMSKEDAGTSKSIDFYSEYVKAAGENIGDTLENLSIIVKQTGERAALRDAIMVRNLGTKVTELVGKHPKLRVKKNVTALATLGTNHDPAFRALWNSKHTHDQVSADTWSGGKPSYEDKVINAYRDGHLPTESDFAAFMLSVAFTDLSLQGEYLYDHEDIYKRDQDVPFGVRLIDAMVSDDIQTSIAISHRILQFKKRLGGRRAMLEEEDRETILFYIAKIEEAL